MIPRFQQVLCLWLAVLTLTARGESSAFVEHPVSPWLNRAYQTDAGLPDISITGLAQTEDGYLWVATRGGLLCYNGATFVPLPPGNLPSPSSRTVRAIFRDALDRLWVAMERGPVFCMQSDGLRAFTVENGLFTQRVLAITGEADGTVWIVYPTQLRKIQDGRVQPVKLPAAIPELGSMLATSDSLGNVWCARNEHLIQMRGGVWQPEIKMGTPITALAAGAGSNVWMAAGNTLYEVSPGCPPVAVTPLPTNAITRLLLNDQIGRAHV